MCDFYCVFENNYVYANIPQRDSYNNTSFDCILEYIGRFYYQMEKFSINEVCRRISKDINNDWKLNKIRRASQGLRISTKQIKSIRRTFINNNSKRHIKIPFKIVSIVYYILCMIKRTIEMDIIRNDFNNNIINLLNGNTILNVLYSKHYSALNSVYHRRIYYLNDSKLIDKYEELYAELTSADSLFGKRFNEIDWAYAYFTYRI